MIFSFLFLVSITAQASQGRYTLSAPEGWVVDTENGKAQGLQVVLYPKGTSWASGTVVMYANTVAKSEADPSASAEKVMNDDIAAFRKQSPSLKVGELKQVKTAKGKVALARDFEQSVGGNYEAVAYVDEPRSVVILALSARTKADFDRARPAFDRLIGSYEMLEPAQASGVAAGDTYAAVEEALHRTALKKAEKDLSSKPGKAYSRTFGHAFEKRYPKLVVDCVKATKVAEEAALEFVVKVGDDGRAADVIALEKNLMAQCLRQKLRELKWPAPPFAPFHARVSLRLK
jgi:hypothetical protein